MHETYHTAASSYCEVFALVIAVLQAGFIKLKLLRAKFKEKVAGK